MFKNLKLLFSVVLFSLTFSVSAFAQEEEVKEKALQLSVAEIQEVLSGKQIQYQSASNGTCTVDFKKDGTLASVCAGGSGIGTYKVGKFDTKGSEDVNAKPRFCMIYSYKPNEPFCSILYRRSDGSVWFSANKIKLLIIKEI